MINASEVNDIGKLTSKLYKTAEKIADTSKFMLKDPDANALFNAFDNVLNFRKHGNPIHLPSYLQEEIPMNLQYLIQNSEKAQNRKVLMHNF